jgi:sortase (surface protein transpeptidase)
MKTYTNNNLLTIGTQKCYHIDMIYSWDETKNRYLSINRNMSFERTLVALEEGDILQVLQNPNQYKYKNQKIYILNIDNYAWVVPFRDEADKRVLITAYPSRKFTAEYLGGGLK